MSPKNIEAQQIKIEISKLNQKITVEFQNLKNYDFYSIKQELAKCNFKINITPNGLEKYRSFNNNSKLVFIEASNV